MQGLLHMDVGSAVPLSSSSKLSFPDQIRCVLPFYFHSCFSDHVFHPIFCAKLCLVLNGQVYVPRKVRPTLERLGELGCFCPLLLITHASFSRLLAHILLPLRPQLSPFPLLSPKQHQKQPGSFPLSLPAVGTLGVA